MSNLDPSFNCRPTITGVISDNKCCVPVKGAMTDKNIIESTFQTAHTGDSNGNNKNKIFTPIVQKKKLGIYCKKGNKKILITKEVFSNRYVYTRFNRIYKLSLILLLLLLLILIYSVK